MRVKNERTENHYIIIVAICITNLFVLVFYAKLVYMIIIALSTTEVISGLNAYH